MPRRSIRRPELEPHQRVLAHMINNALNGGQCGDGKPERFWMPWTNSKFADVAKVSERSVANWRDPDALMPPEDIQPLLKTFYGNIDRFKGDRGSMERQWRLARGYIVDDEDVHSSDWEVGKSPNLQGTASLVTLQTHPPVPANDGTLRLSIYISDLARSRPKLPWKGNYSRFSGGLASCGVGAIPTDLQIST
jgi:hypothetical protein